MAILAFWELTPKCEMVEIFPHHKYQKYFKLVMILHSVLVKIGKKEQKASVMWSIVTVCGTVYLILCSIKFLEAVIKCEILQFLFLLGWLNRW